MSRLIAESTVAGHRLETVVARLRRAFAEHATETAVISGGQTITYGELADRVRLASAGLRRAGVGRADLIGIHIPRSTELIVAVLAVLDAGAAYVPLDPSYPQDRLRIYTRVAGLETIIHDAQDVADQLLAGQGRVVTVDDLIASGGETDDGAWFSAPAADDPCYVYFTSGSTGTPKGIRVLHRNLDHFVEAFRSDAVAPVEDGRPRWLNLSSVSFDPWTVEVVQALAHGDEVVLAPPGAALDVVVSGRLAETLAQHPVTHIQCTPTALSVMLSNAATRRMLVGVRQLLIGGEAFPIPLAEQALEAAPQAQITNVYGPTETTVWSFRYHLPRGSAAVLEATEGAGSVPIGGPLSGVTAILADPGPEHAAEGLHELVIGGAQVTAGYLNPPDGVRSPFQDGTYRTGDLVRTLADGTLQFAGRVDDQVKVRGHRLELGEIEAVIASHPGVQQAVAWVHDDEIVTAILPAPGVDVPETAELIDLASQKLPPAAVPGAVTVLDHVPTTPSGKANRAALAAAHRERLTSSDAAGERREISVSDLIGYFRDVLGAGAGPIDADSDFFAHGGTSVLAVRLLGQVLQHSGVRLGLAELVYAPSPQLLAQRLGDAVSSVARAEVAADKASGCLVPIHAGSPDGPTFYCVHGIGGNVVNLIPMARDFTDPWSFVAIQANGVDGRGVPDRSVAEMARRYTDAIKAQSPQGPYYLGGYSDGGIIALACAQLLVAAGEQIALVVLFDSEPPQPGGRTLRHRLRHAIANLREHGVGTIVRGGVQAMNRRFSPTRREADRSLGYGAVEVFGYVDLTQNIGAALNQYDLGPSSFPVALIRAMDRRPGDQPLDAWDGYFRGRFSVHETPGDHLNMLDADRAPALANLVMSALNSGRAAIRP